MERDVAVDEMDGHYMQDFQYKSPSLPATPKQNPRSKLEITHSKKLSLIDAFLLPSLHPH
jgi:hypothetical protein